MDASVAVAHRVDVDEAERDDGSARQRLPSARRLLERLESVQHSVQRSEVRVDVVDDVVANGGLTHEDRRLAHAEAKRGFAEDTLLQHGEAVDAQWLELAAVLGHDVGKPLDAIGLVRLVLDQETRPRLLEREEPAAAHKHVLAELAVWAWRSPRRDRTAAPGRGPGYGARADRTPGCPAGCC